MAHLDFVCLVPGGTYSLCDLIGGGGVPLLTALAGSGQFPTHRRVHVEAHTHGGSAGWPSWLLPTQNKRLVVIPPNPWEGREGKLQVVVPGDFEVTAHQAWRTCWRWSTLSRNRQQCQSLPYTQVQKLGWHAGLLSANVPMLFQTALPWVA